MNEVIDLFELSYKKYGDVLISKRYNLPPGVYVKININGSRDIYTLVDLKKNQELHDWFAVRDISSSLISTNKPVDTKKQILSNNYLSLFINFSKIDKAKERLNDYFTILKDEDKLEYVEKLENNRNYILSNYENIMKETIKLNQNPLGVLKIFFEAPLELYRQEGERYLKNKLFLNGYSNKSLDKQGLGIPSSFITLNPKKPYLQHKTMENKAPHFTTIDRAIIIEKFRTWLSTFKSNSTIYVLHDQDFNEFIYTQYPEQPCYLISIKKEKTGVYLTDYECLPGNVFKTLSVDNAIDAEEYINGSWELIDPFALKSRKEMENYVDDIFFNGMLIKNYNIDGKDIKVESDLKELILSTRDVFYNYFRKGNSTLLPEMITKYGLDYVKYHISNGSDNKAKKAFNLYLSLKNI